MKNFLFLFFLLFESILLAQGFSEELEKSFPKPEQRVSNQESSQSLQNNKLVQACKDGDLLAVKQSLAAGADINFITDYKKDRVVATKVTPLIIAIHQKHSEIANYLIDQNANIDHSFSIRLQKTQLENINALFASLMSGNQQLFKKLLHLGAKTGLHLQGKMQGATVKNLSLLTACLLEGKKDLIRYLLLFDVDVNMPVTILQTNKKIKLKNLAPIHFATMEGNTKLVQMVLFAGAEVNVKADLAMGKENQMQNITPLMLAASEGNIALVKMLLLFGARLDDRASGMMEGTNIDGYTPIDFARKENRLEAIKLLEYAKQQQEALASDEQEQ